jgi:hypothetical protein
MLRLVPLALAIRLEGSAPVKLTVLYEVKPVPEIVIVPPILIVAGLTPVITGAFTVVGGAAVNVTATIAELVALAPEEFLQVTA